MLRWCHIDSSRYYAVLNTFRIPRTFSSGVNCKSKAARLLASGLIRPIVLSFEAWGNFNCIINCIVWFNSQLVIVWNRLKGSDWTSIVDLFVLFSICATFIIETRSTLICSGCWVAFFLRINFLEIRFNFLLGKFIQCLSFYECIINQSVYLIVYFRFYLMDYLTDVCYWLGFNYEFLKCLFFESYNLLPDLFLLFFG